MSDLIRITSKEQLQRVALSLGVREDWHEPDEQEVHAEVFGQRFDNAGFWGWHHEASDSMAPEAYVVLLKDGRPVAEVNLATLFAIACQ